jgi:hypothetical protein
LFGEQHSAGKSGDTGPDDRDLFHAS